ncbi:MAG TPA: glycosyltransferase family 39 protein [Gallionella sp.]|nr:glycosyltransferase family 39 protein [Gallionella sp.]
MTTTASHSFRPLLIAAVLSFLPMLNLYYVGEEAIFPITSMEMWQHGAWLKQYLYGGDVQHNPLFNWLIIVFANLFGWPHVLEVARGLTICATLATAAVLSWLAWRLFRERSFAVFAALIYLTFNDVLMYHGWLAYVDPLFALFIFTAIAALWVACAEQRRGLLWVAAIALTCALLSKAFTAYVFYGAALVVLARNRTYRGLLFSPMSLLAHAAMLLAPLLWFALIPAGHSQSGRMFGEILAKLAFPGIGAYLAKLLLYPLEIWSGLLPAGVLVIYFALRRRITQIETQPEHFRSALLIVMLNFLPYWLAPYSGVRYLMPIYPLFALIAARLIWRAGLPAVSTTRRWLAAAIALSFVLGLLAFPYYQQQFRGANYAQAAADIIARTQGQPLYVTDSTAAGLNVTAYINQLRYPQQALQFPPEKLDTGFIIARTPDSTPGEIVREYQLGGDRLYLLCRGTACKPGLPIN